MAETRICFTNNDVQACNTTRKRKDAISWCRGNQEGCQPLSGGTYYTDCGGFNLDCKIYELDAGIYKPVKDGYYSNGTITYYVQNGITMETPYTCTRFFRIDWIKDCLANDNLSGVYYLTVVDDELWVPDTSVVYHVPIPLSINSTDCSAIFGEDAFYAIRFLNTTPVYNIGNSGYLDVLVAEMANQFKLPGLLQNRCKTRIISV